MHNEDNCQDFILIPIRVLNEQLGMLYIGVYLRSSVVVQDDCQGLIVSKGIGIFLQLLCVI